MVENSQGAEDVAEKYSLWALLGVLGDKLHTFLYTKSSWSWALRREKKLTGLDILLKSYFSEFWWIWRVVHSLITLLPVERLTVLRISLCFYSHIFYICFFLLLLPRLQFITAIDKIFHIWTISVASQLSSLTFQSLLICLCFYIFSFYCRLPKIFDYNCL